MYIYGEKQQEGKEQAQKKVSINNKVKPIRYA